MKAITRATEEAVEHRLALKEHFERDGRIDECEQRLLDSAGTVYKWIEAAGVRYKVGFRVINGGRLDNEIMAEANDLQRLCREIRANESGPTGEDRAA